MLFTLLALFAGGYVVGRLAGFPKQSTAGLQGVLAWAYFTLLSRSPIESGIGRESSVVGSTRYTVASTVGSAVGAVIPST